MTLTPPTDTCTILSLVLTLVLGLLRIKIKIMLNRVRDTTELGTELMKYFAHFAHLVTYQLSAIFQDLGSSLTSADLMLVTLAIALLDSRNEVVTDSNG